MQDMYYAAICIQNMYSRIHISPSNRPLDYLVTALSNNFKYLPKPLVFTINKLFSVLPVFFGKQPNLGPPIYICSENSIFEM